MSMLIRTFQSNVSLNGSTVNNTTEQDKIYNRITLVPLFMTLYGIIFLVAFGGNLLVIYVVSTNRKMHEVTVNYLLVNLAIADLIQTLSSIFHVADFLLKDLNIGEVGCKFQINMNNIPYGASVLTLGVIAYDRYCAVCKSVSFGDGRSVKRILWFVPLTWLVSVCIYIPTLIYCGLRVDTKDKNQLTCDCTEQWPSLRAKNIYGIGIVVLLYVVPLIFICRLYLLVIRKLRQPIPGEDAGTTITYQSRQGVVKMLLVTIASFFVSWTPYNILYFLKRIKYDFRSVYSFVWYPALLLAFLSCAFNPVIYCFLSKNFRKAFKATLCCKTCQNCGEFPLAVLHFPFVRTPQEVIV
ncbi:gastrin/cholecystokinin type B receptor-like isoform X2 [Xenia sp. Carnegie-2017]|uniref:gastrin/cholecystokinin type B receptor-like isoform X2 n=1 Tax=Xenia sp. Carnegie-2017 TaxID=2897299 RepID=UPI001F032EDC|nr:gastrin/cholecystokinin type B receptor-like isoform X2 [Xenia sp. Carnegie-2017]